jgi:arginine-tRNA-protein transferase
VNFREVWNQPEPCPYRPAEVARLPLRVPERRLSGADLDAQLAAGDRRTGRMMYVPTCDTCSACEGLRVDIARFEPNKTQRRVWRRNVEELTVTVGPPVVDTERIELFNRHKLERGLSRSGEGLTAAAYRQWLVDTCCTTVEVDYREGDRLVGVSIVDLGERDASSVYHYFNPDDAGRSLGVFSALAEMAWLRGRGFRWYYLGLYVSDCAALAYKANYRPHQRREAGVWVDGERA